MVSGLLHGVGLGFAIAAPVGPIGLLCIQRTIAHGRAIGLATGLGAASADAIYGLLAAMGVGAVTGLLLEARQPLALVGGLLLIGLGWRTARRPPPAPPIRSRAAALGSAFTSTFALTLANPATILSFAAAFAASGLALRGGAALVAGVFAGSALWWLLLVLLVAGLRRRLAGGVLVWINRAAGFALAGFGTAALVAALLAG